MAVVKIGELLGLGVDESALSSYVPYSSLEYNADSQITGISGSAIAGGEASFDGVYHDATLTGSGLSSSLLGVKSMELEFDTATMTRTLSGNTATVAVNTAFVPSYTFPVQVVAQSSEATGANIVYVVTGITP